MVLRLFSWFEGRKLLTPPRLYYDGTKMSDSSVLGDYGFEESDTIDCMLDHSTSPWCR